MKQQKDDWTTGPYVGRNLDALQERVAQIVIGLDIVRHQPTEEWVLEVTRTIDRIQDQAKEYGSEVIRLLGKRELMLVAGRKPVGSTYPIIAIMSDVELPDACMLWVPGHEHFYRVIAYRGEGFGDNRRFDGSTLVFDEGLFVGGGHYCCKIDPWSRVDKLRVVPTGPNDHVLLNDPLGGWVAKLFSCLQTEVPLKCRVPLVVGEPSDYSTWRWSEQACGLHITVLGNMV
jgi:hypothetical protein